MTPGNGHYWQGGWRAGDYIVTDPAVCNGKPCFKGTRVMVHLVLELLEAGTPVEEITSERYYPQLTREHVEAALHYAAQLFRTREYVLPEAVG